MDACTLLDLLNEHGDSLGLAGVAFSSNNDSCLSQVTSLCA
jgi:hypothetical protein